MSPWLGRPGVFHLTPPESAQSVAAAAAAAGITVYVVPPVASKAEFLDALAEALSFPDWSGRNWDAAADLLGDPTVLPTGRWVLVWVDAACLQRADPDAYRVARGILVEASASRGLTVLLVET